ncbi:unnamed protein product [Chondrus crispus]|uniref:Uncharacterized protein n=1 Tax=Chondrus crispus TaxID=2769 RepID=R7QK08_CHOCR|nr:unnamed protein product [Chondrus crispus]CDF38068.1 unnamed protein product [Chondrus crispus]|eukprot:XP_005717937.1 unnamed protein product [Chondrus crispus]
MPSQLSIGAALQLLTSYVTLPYRTVPFATRLRSSFRKTSMCAPCNARCAFHLTRAPIPCHSSQPTSFLSPFSRRLSLLANPIRGLTTASYSAPLTTSETPVALPPLFLRPQYTCSFRQPLPPVPPAPASTPTATPRAHLPTSRPAF